MSHFGLWKKSSGLNPIRGSTPAILLRLTLDCWRFWGFCLSPNSFFIWNIWFRLTVSLREFLIQLFESREQSGR
jgi:hypothetical protein